MRAAWDGLDAAKVWDCHAHLLGSGDSGSGIFVNPRMDSLFNPAQYARRLFFLNAGCVHDARGSVDQAYVERMHNLLDGMRPGVKLLLFAFERAHDERGVPDMERTAFHVPDAYARDTAKRHAAYFEWAASIHPYRRDAVEALQKARGEGARDEVAPRDDGNRPRVHALRRVLSGHEETRDAPDLACRGRARGSRP